MKKVLSIIVSLMLIVSPVYALDSEGVIYDNSTSGSSATNVNDALNDLYSKLDTIKNIGNATSDKILSGYTAYVKGNTITGSIPSKGATTYTPGTSNQTIASGQYLSGVQTIKGDSNLVASNIAKGKSIFGISGTYTSDATATAADIKSGKTAYVNGSKVTGTNTGGDYKVYKFDKIQATVDSNQTFTLGTWKKIVTTGTHTVHFKIPLGFTPTEEISCYAYLSGNYKTTSTSTETSYNFRFKNGNYSYLYLLTSYLNVGQTALNSTNVQNVITCQVSGDKLVLQIEGVKSSGGLAEPIYETRADIFYLSGTLVYK